MAQRLDYQSYAQAGMKALGGVHHYIATCGLPKLLVNLVYLRTSQINVCAYCIATHSHDLVAEGVAAEKLLLLSSWRETGTWFSDQERAALAWAEAVTLVASTHVPDEVFAAAWAVFSEKQLVDLTLAVGLINAYNRVAISFRHGPPSRPLHTHPR
jgi:AhpD family alkylhydroperoxidase